MSVTKPFFDPYLEKCQVLVLTEKEIHLEFCDKFTFDLVDTPENIQILRETVKTVCGRDVEIKLKLNLHAEDVPAKTQKEKKKKPIDYQLMVKAMKI